MFPFKIFWGDSQPQQRTPKLLSSDKTNIYCFEATSDSLIGLSGFKPTSFSFWLACESLLCYWFGYSSEAIRTFGRVTLPLRSPTQPGSSVSCAGPWHRFPSWRDIESCCAENGSPSVHTQKKGYTGTFIGFIYVHYKFALQLAERVNCVFAVFQVEVILATNNCTQISAWMCW